MTLSAQYGLRSEFSDLQSLEASPTTVTLGSVTYYIVTLGSVTY